MPNPPVLIQVLEVSRLLDRDERIPLVIDRIGKALGSPWKPPGSGAKAGSISRSPHSTLRYGRPGRDDGEVHPVFGERRGLKLQVQAYNVLHHPEFNGVGSALQFDATRVQNSLTAGVFNGTLPARILAFGRGSSSEEPGNFGFRCLSPQ